MARLISELIWVLNFNVWSNVMPRSDMVFVVARGMPEMLKMCD